jgi:hypothetical protein
MKPKAKPYGKTRGRANAAPRNEREAHARERAFAALARMRREKVSLAAASRLEHVKPATIVRHVGSAIRQDKSGGRYRATKGDRFRRDLQIPTAQGPVTVPIYGSKNAENISKYLNAVSHYLRTGDESKLRPFKGKSLKVAGKRVKLITDPDTLSKLAEADALHLDQLYASTTGRS